MGYWQGKHLQRRVKEYGLEDLSTLIQKHVEGDAPWTGTIEVGTAPGEVEIVRNIIYSILLELKAKELFKVKLAKAGVLHVEKRALGNRVTLQAYIPPIDLSPDDTEPIGDEGLREIMEEENE